MIYFLSFINFFKDCKNYNVNILLISLNNILVINIILIFIYLLKKNFYLFFKYYRNFNSNILWNDLNNLFFLKYLYNILENIIQYSYIVI